MVGVSLGSVHGQEVQAEGDVGRRVDHASENGLTKVIGRVEPPMASSSSPSDSMSMSATRHP